MRVVIETGLLKQGGETKNNGGILPLEMGVFTRDHFVVVNNVEVGNIVPVRAFSIKDSNYDIIANPITELTNGDTNEIPESLSILIDEARSIVGRDFADSIIDKWKHKGAMRVDSLDSGRSTNEAGDTAPSGNLLRHLTTLYMD